MLFGISNNKNELVHPRFFFPQHFLQTSSSYISSLSWFDTQRAGQWSVLVLVLYKWYLLSWSFAPDPEFPLTPCNRDLRSLCNSSRGLSDVVFNWRVHTLSSPGLSHVSANIYICAVKHSVSVIIRGRDFPGQRCYLLWETMRKASAETMEEMELLWKHREHTGKVKE